MLVWLDDQEIRDPKSGWTVVRTADEAIALLAAGGVEAISLDHDLGDIRHEPHPREATGMDVVRWMVANQVFPKVVNIHSLNPVAAKTMLFELELFAPADIQLRMWRFDRDTTADLERLLVSVG
jgi:hypothetical protein